ncbi:uncharacterized protein N7515_003876 [Penicillium bovifimosum]|uniref:Uncharacterized protein n=1 Tax=Penicillium bovifimosum TaxID=126998 RepID=A0A9W9H5Z1_9EURO|nr:uncharacterized protein N7515_003876 [Penicillium bovifimosum]KAJ5139028.1 hypothetical protein N7515_003876 [Penicillium bovifimosum]
MARGGIGVGGGFAKWKGRSWVRRELASGLSLPAAPWAKANATGTIPRTLATIHCRRNIDNDALYIFTNVDE